MSNSLRITGTASARSRVKAISRRAKSMERAAPAVARTLEEHVSQTFDSRGASTGNPWEPLSKPYTIRKNAQGNPGPLVLSGSLRDSFFGGKWHLIEVGGASLRWGTRHPLAHLHQRGSKGRRVPARPFVVVTPELRRQVRDGLRDYLLKSN